MVFATDFDPIDSRSTTQRKSQRSKSSQARISPVHQTNRLIAQAQAQKAAQQTAQKPQFPTKVEEFAEIEVASRGMSSPARSVVEQPVVETPSAVSPLVTPLRKPKLPLALKVLSQVQHGSTMVASTLIAGALVLYGSSVYVDRSVNHTMSHLNQLQSESQQLTSANEAIKQSLAEQAIQEGSGLEPYEAGDVLFVAPEPLRAEKEVAETEKTERFRPVGY